MSVLNRLPPAYGLCISRQAFWQVLIKLMLWQPSEVPKVEDQ